MSDTPLQIYIDGEFYSKENAKISVFDHGLLYGDGVFEGIRFYNGRVFQHDEHIERIFDSAKAIHLEIPVSKQELGDIVLATIKENKLQDGYVRLIVTRGAGELGLSPYRCEKASIIVIASTISLYPEEKYEKGLILATCATRRPTHDSLSPAVKSLNYLSNVMAKVECMAAGAEEGVMLNSEGYVAECTGDNIFIVKNGIISTPTVASGSLYGITRTVVINLVREAGYELREVQMTRYDLYTADELFLTGTAAEVVPVAEYDKRKIGTGTTGPITKELIGAFRNLVETTGTAIY
ncbi:branched-chain-amino-acid transaminase [Verrucomicrobiales bacterium BCK34]|nr:branched-chain-amino-acid transaminase [Verrucomicrobiales bacterium BCK34]